MNLKMILTVTLMVLVVMGMITYGYLMYSINSNAGGATLITNHKLMVYSELVIQLLQVAVGVVMIYRT